MKDTVRVRKLRSHTSRPQLDHHRRFRSSHHHWKLLNPKRKRAAVEMGQSRFGVSERFACRTVGQHCSSQRLTPPDPADDDAEIREHLRKFAKDRPRWGWRRAAAHLRNKGHLINNKRVRRLWREEGLRVATRRKKKRLTGVGTHIGAMSLIRPNALWAMDFQFDQMVDGRQVKLLNVIDEYTRECLAIVVDHSIDAERVVGTLARLAVERGQAPAFVRFDNGPELVSHTIADWCADAGVDAVFIDPGSPWQNAWIESFNGRLRDELLLNGWQFDLLLEAQVLIEDHRIDYNTNSPHTALGLLTPTEYANQWATTNQPHPA